MSLFLYQITGRHGDTGVVIAETEENAIEILRKRYSEDDCPLFCKETFDDDNVLLVSELDDDEVPGLYIITKG